MRGVLIRNAAYNLAGQLAVVLIGLVAVRFVFRAMGGDAVGILYASASLGTVLAAALDLGISATVVKEIATWRQSQPRYVEEVVRTATTIFWAGYLFSVILVFAATPFLASWWLHLTTVDSQSAARTIEVFAAGFLLAIPRSVYVSVLRGVQRMAFNNAIDAALTTAQQAVTIFLASKGYDLMAIATAYTLLFALGLIPYAVISARLFSRRAIVPGWSQSAIRRNFSFSSHMLGIMLLSMLHMQSDRIFLSRFWPVANLGYYALASRLVSGGSLITSAIAQASFPALSQLQGEGEVRAHRNLYLAMHQAICLATAPVFGAVVLASTPLFAILLNSSIATTLFLPTVTLALGYYMNATLHAPYVASLSMGRPDITSRSNLLALVTVLPITGLLVYLLGMEGAALGWIAYHIWQYGYAVRRICSECLSNRFRDWLAGTARIALVAVGAYSLPVIAAQLMAPESILVHVTAFGAATALYIALGWLILGGDTLQLIFRSVAKET